MRDPDGPGEQFYLQTPGRELLAVAHPPHPNHSLPPPDRWAGGTLQQDPEVIAAEGRVRHWQGLGHLLPYLVFAYRELPQASTGFSPFELLHGRALRGPLDVLRETWEADSRSTESVVSHVLALHDKLASMTELVQENLREAQRRQKRWYDRTAREREFKQGDEVLVLFPMRASKLKARWQGPYRVVRRAGKVTYQVDMHDTRRRKRLLHVNMLRQWHTPATSLFAEVATVEEGVEDCPEWRDSDPGQPTVGDQLSAQERADLGALLQEFGDVLQRRPGRTAL